MAEKTITIKVSEADFQLLGSEVTSDNAKLVQRLLRGHKDIEYRRGHMGKRNEDVKEAMKLLEAKRAAEGNASAKRTA